MVRDRELKAHRATIDAAYERTLEHVARHAPDGAQRLRRAVSVEGRRLMSRALAKASVIEHLRDGATGRASLRSLSASPEPLIVAAAVGAAMSDDAEAVESLVREADVVLASVGPWTSGNASRMIHQR